LLARVAEEEDDADDADDADELGVAEAEDEPNIDKKELTSDELAGLADEAGLAAAVEAADGLATDATRPPGH
jgi:hypothetical protein